ncbi:hypothetical protein TKK_0013282 [Trichogramma kaykai]
MDSINFIDELYEIKATTITGSWKKILPQGPWSLSDQPTELEYPSVVENIIDLAKEVTGEGFDDLQASEIINLVMPLSTERSAEEIEEIATCSTADDQAENVIVESSFNAKLIVEILNLIENAVEQALVYDPVMVRSLNFKRLCDEATQAYQEMYKDVLRRAR